MKLATSTGDYKRYCESIAEAIGCFRSSKFKYINLEQTGILPAFFSECEDDWKQLADSWGEAAAQAGITYAVSHAPCLNVFDEPGEEQYRAKVRAIRRSIEICHRLGIDRIVVHACPNDDFTEEEFYTKNKAFYREFFDLTEAYNITVMTENWDDHATHFSTGKQLRTFVDYVNHPLLAVCWDTAHGNIDPVARELGQYQNILDIGEKLKGLHISDNFGDTHHHSWPFAGTINFDSVMQGLLDVNYDGFFTFEASYTLRHNRELPIFRKEWEYRGQPVTKLLAPSLELKKQAVELLYETGKYILQAYDCFEE